MCSSSGYTGEDQESVCHTHSSSMLGQCPSTPIHPSARGHCANNAGRPSLTSSTSGQRRHTRSRKSSPMNEITSFSPTRNVQEDISASSGFNAAASCKYPRSGSMLSVKTSLQSHTRAGLAGKLIRAIVLRFWVSTHRYASRR